MTGHCEAKRVFNEVSEQAGMAEGRSHHMPFERYDSNKEQLQANAAAATNGTTVTGNDDLKSPPAGVRTSPCGPVASGPVCERSCQAT